MEIEKTRETSWKIQLRNRNENVELTSVENSGEVRSIKLGLLKENDSLRVEMNKEEFFNFLSLISAFKDVVIGDSYLVSNLDYPLSKKSTIESNGEETTLSQEYESYSENSINSKKEEKSNEEELNPKEWDPW